jgi:ABC-type multidrug transport system ATPase subunit
LQDYSLPFYYFDPFSWSVRSMAVSQFRDDQYNVPISPQSGAPSQGEAYASIFALDFEFSWKIAGPFVLLGYYIIFGVILCTLALMWVKPKALLGTKRVTAEAAATAAASGNGNDEHSVLPFTPASLAFEGITYTVMNPRTKKQLTLLTDVSGVAKPGTMTALMGASGAGKTTLLDVLADRKTSGEIIGAKVANGKTVSKKEFSRLSAYCEQEDIHLPTTTVREAIEFSALLRLESTVTSEQRASFVSWILRVLELATSANRVVSSLAPGERKRLTIGVELAANSPILFLDEPTTGLDSRSAAVVMRVIKKIANAGRTVIATIHQPNAAIFFDFSHLILLAPGGLQVYAGPLGHHGADMVSFIQGLPGVLPLPSNTNPATWMIEQTRPTAQTHANTSEEHAEVLDGLKSPVVAATEEVASLSQYFRSSALYTANTDNVRKAMKEEVVSPAGTQAPSYASWLQRLYLVSIRAQKDVWRNATLQPIRIFVFLFISLFFGMTYYNVRPSSLAYMHVYIQCTHPPVCVCVQIGDSTTQTSVLSKLGVLFSGPVFSAIVILNTTTPGLYGSRAVFYRERAAHFYSPEAHSITLVLRDNLWHVFYALLFASISYFMEGLKPDAAAFFTYWFGLYLLLVNYGAMSNWIAAVFPSPQVAQIIAGVIITLLNLFAGVTIPVNEVPEGWKWMYYSDGVGKW